ncbi:replication factor C subunit 1 [Aspergillus fijiensis CBS 313.89]|uniref:Replication factor C subunit 1 n=1 Tax=Aspergillus fijiensis CBS 313.89 TaxID=1448319 RepID=A0A8G1VWV3_9EURO|nr:chromosome transmission fidelity factor [Aspergillus fijiensis CBS 313.89]RAK74581.1 chromosome transmission fidelity factor [Aspergillus fijiensis CBS 313.89]
MPSDIRSFFGAKSSQGSNASPAKPAAKKEEPATRKKRTRKVVDDSDDEEVTEVKPSTPKAKTTSKPKPEESQGEPTSTSDYFASSKKRGRPAKSNNATTAKPSQPTPAEPVHESPKPKTRADTQTTPKRATRGSTRKTTTVVDDDEGLGGDDVFATEYKKRGKGDDDYVEEDEQDGSDDEFEELAVKPASPVKRTGRSKQPPPAESGDDVVMEDLPKRPSRAAQSTTSRPARKRKSEALDKEEDSEFEASPKKSAVKAKATSHAAKKPRASPTKTDRPESKEIQDIFDSIPTVKAPSPPPQSGEKTKFNFAAQAQRSRSPVGGGVELPVGAENCLAGLSFVFTGLLDTLGREEGQTLVKKYGGKVTGAPSSKTSYVVLGADAGPKKLQTIRQHKIKTINEEGLFELIRRLPANGGDGKAGEKYEAKKKADEAKVKAMAAEIDKEEKRKEMAARASNTVPPSASQASTTASQPAKVADELWTTKYAPTSISMICGNKTLVERLQNWLRDWHKNAKYNFKRPGKDGSGLYRAVIIHGPPGIGKTTAAHLVAKLENYDVVETNASDTRSKKLVENGLVGVLDTTSLQGYFAGEGKKVNSDKKKLVLIMDEVDGMSAGDRGGVGALVAVAKKTHIPLILISNEWKIPKLKPFEGTVFELAFRRPSADQMRARLSTICYREQLRIPAPVLDGLIEGTHSDIRQIINMLSTVKLDQQNLNYEKGREMSKAWEKHIILKPWDIVNKILGPQMFAHTSKSTLNDKIELYFNDHEFSYLMVQENYLKTRQTLASGYQGREQRLKQLELIDNAASSISDGDLVDRMIHGTQQQWSLMPTHAAFSFVRPASFVYGAMGERPTFAGWLGQNSKQGKLWRYVKEIQGHMRLRASGDRDEIRQQYMPLLWDRLVRRLKDEGKDAVEEVIDFMDSYFLTREDWDALVELGLGPMDAEHAKLETQTKASFTRVYNQRSHPLPFIKASSVTAPKKMAKEKPDIEDAVEESDEEEVVEESKDDEAEELDLKKDKYVRVPKKSATKGGASKGKKTKKTADEDDFDDEEKPKKARGRKPKAKSG